LFRDGSRINVFGSCGFSASLESLTNNFAFRKLEHCVSGRLWKLVFNFLAEIGARNRWLLGVCLDLNRGFSKNSDNLKLSNLTLPVELLNTGGQVIKSDANVSLSFRI
jgi:hypothetical protein